eukprot:gene3327-4537_t
MAAVFAPLSGFETGVWPRGKSIGATGRGGRFRRGCGEAADRRRRPVEPLARHRDRLTYPLTFIFALTVTLLVASLPLRATSVTPPTFSALTARAETIVRAEVLSARSELVERAGSRAIFTYVTFRIDEVRWAGPPALQALNLSGSYSYKAAEHALEVKGVDIADGHYSARVKLQGPAPMAIDASLNGRVKAPLAEDHDIDVLAEATVKGTLTGTEARLQVAAELKPAEESPDAPMEARLQAQIAPWLPQPVIDAKADLRNVDASSLWPGAPETRLTGTVELTPDADTGPAAWKASADIRNSVAGPWDEEKLPVEQVQARVGFDGTSWTIPEATVRAGGGRIDAAGKWSPAP